MLVVLSRDEEGILADFVDTGKGEHNQLLVVAVVDLRIVDSGIGSTG